MKPLAGYVRVSHVGGRSEDSFHSPREQAQEIERWAQAQGHRVVMLDPELDAKGSDAARPTFRAAVEGVKAGDFAGVVVAYLSRAGRDLRLMLDLWDEVEAVGGTVYSARENIDASTSSGKLHRNILASIAQHELEERRDGFERATKGAVERGIWQRRQTPLGYRKDSTTRGLMPDRAASKVRSAFDDFLSGKTISDIAVELGMTTSGVRQLLRNRVYLGELKVRSYVKTEAHESLIDLETFEAAQAKLAQHTRPARNGNGPALLAGLVYCASCGHVMTRGSSNGGHAYVCRKKHSGGQCPAPSGVMTARLEAHVEAIALAELARLEVTATESSQVAPLQAALRDAERELDAFVTEAEAAGLSAGTFAKGARSREDAVNDAREALRAELARQPSLPISGSGADAWKDLSVHERNALLRSLIAAVVVRSVGRGRKVPIDERCRVVAYGQATGIPRRRGGEATGIVALPFPDADAVGVLRVPPSQDRA